jgi:hypothetical protein
MLVRGKLNRFLEFLRCAVVGVTEMAVELTFYYKFFTLTFHHAGLDTISAGCFIAAFQENWFSILQIEETLADGAFEFGILRLFHNIYIGRNKFYYLVLSNE